MNNEKEKQNNRYIVIQDFMISDLGLKGASLIVYAVIYGFSRIEDQYYTGSLHHLMEWANLSKQGAIKVLKELKGRGLIKAVPTGKGNSVKYKALEYKEAFDDQSGKQSLPEVVNKVDQCGKQSLPPTNNIDLKIDNNILYNTRARAYEHIQEKFESCPDSKIAEEIQFFLNEGIEDEMICAVIDYAVDERHCRSWNYIRRILFNKLKRGIKTLDKFQADAEYFRKNVFEEDSKKALPEYKPPEDEYNAYLASMREGASNA